MKLLGHQAVSLGAVHAENLVIRAVLRIPAFFPLQDFVRKFCSFINRVFAVGEKHVLHPLYLNYLCFLESSITELYELSSGFFCQVQLQAHFPSSCAINADYGMADSVVS